MLGGKFMKSLRTINVILKILKVICYIIFGCAIAGAVGTVIGLGIFSLIKDMVIQDGKTLTMLLLEKQVTVAMAYTYMAMALLSCLFTIALSFIMAKFLKGIINDTTPFTRKTVTNMRKLGLWMIIASLICGVLCGIAVLVVKKVDPASSNMTYWGSWSIGFGLWMLFLSLFVEYPVEIEEENKKLEAESLKPEDYVE